MSTRHPILTKTLSRRQRQLVRPGARLATARQAANTNHSCWQIVQKPVGSAPRRVSPTPEFQKYGSGHGNRVLETSNPVLSYVKSVYNVYEIVS